MDIHNKVKNGRKSKGLSQEELAQRSGLSLRTIQRIENNETTPHGDTLRKIFDTLELIPDIDSTNNSQEIHSINSVSAFFENWKIVLLLYFFSLTIFIASLIIKEGILAKSAIVLSCICIMSLIVATLHQFRKKNWKTAIKVGLLTIMTLIISGSFLLAFMPYKVISATNTNGRIEKVELNLMTGKRDTTIIYEKKTPTK